MSAAKKRKIDDERRVFNNEWCTKYLVVSHNQGVGLPRLSKYDSSYERK